MKNITGVSASNLNRFVSDDELRTSMHNPYLDVEEEVIVCTDSRLMMMIPIEVNDEDESAIIDINAFDLKTSELSKAEYIVRKDETTVKINGKTNRFDAPNEGEFPNWKSVIPSNCGYKPKEINKVNLKTEIMEKIMRGLSIKGWRKRSYLDCTFYGEKAAIEFEVRLLGSFYAEYDHIVRGLVLPSSS